MKLPAWFQRVGAAISGLFWAPRDIIRLQKEILDFESRVDPTIIGMTIINSALQTQALGLTNAQGRITELEKQVAQLRLASVLASVAAQKAEAKPPTKARTWREVQNFVAPDEELIDAKG